MKMKKINKSHQPPATPQSRETLLRNLNANIETLCLVMTADILGKPSGGQGKAIVESATPTSGNVVSALSSNLKQKSPARSRR